MYQNASMRPCIVIHPGHIKSFVTRDLMVWIVLYTTRDSTFDLNTDCKICMHKLNMGELVWDF